jgi:hypothetical protein
MTHSLSDWLAVVSFAVGVHASYCVPYFLTVDADLADFDPRPAVSRAGYRVRLALESGDWDGLLIAVANVTYSVRAVIKAIAKTARTAPRDAAITAAALLALLIPASPERATR